MSIFDILLLLLVTAGNVLSLPIWWWLFGRPIVRFCRHWAVEEKPHECNWNEPEKNIGSSRFNQNKSGESAKDERPLCGRKGRGGIHTKG